MVVSIRIVGSYVGVCWCDIDHSEAAPSDPLFLFLRVTGGALIFCSVPVFFGLLKIAARCC